MIKIDRSKGDGFTKDGKNVRVDVAEKTIANCIEYEDEFFSKVADIEYKQVVRAKDKIEQVLRVIYDSTGELRKAEAELVKGSRQAIGNVKDAAEKLSSGLQRVEKAANFDRLERYVELLERAALAMSTLGDLEKSGRLEKIALAIR